ncbi:branched-chain amino acid ABC transporter permease [Neobacillus niacini]|uniref:branched-chain amino acid ABC transporter permease n=1 Tax=Neobacillus niacini TaxID=86668 RepID=UPI002FFF32EE
MKRIGNAWPWIIAPAVIIIFPFLVGQSNYFLTLFITACTYIVTANALNLLIGFGGQISVGHAGFLTVGAYGVAIIANSINLPFILILLLAGTITAIVGFLIGLPAVRLRGHFLAVATLGFGLSIPEIALNWEKLTGGYTGLMVSRPPFLQNELFFFYSLGFITVFCIWLMKNILHSRMGRAFIAIRDSEVAAQSIGVNIAFYKTIMFTISAFFAGIAGGMSGYWFGFVSPDDFSIMTSFLLLAMIVVGGLGSISGAVIGATVFSILPHFSDSYIGITNIVIGAAVVLVMMFKPSGLVSFLKLKKNTVQSKTPEFKKEVV